MIRDLIREVLDSTTLTEPHDVAEKVLASLPEEDMRAALAEILPTFVQVAFSRSRMVATDDDVQPTRSAKVAAVRDHWAARLATPLNVGGVWKRLGDCTADDLRVVAATLRDSAAKTVAKADWYEALAKRVPKGSTVGALTSDPLAVAA